MARIDKYEAEIAIRSFADSVLPEESEWLIGAMADAETSGMDTEIDEHSEWRGDRGKPHFSARVRYNNPGTGPWVGSDRILVEVEGTFKESHEGLSVDSYNIKDCKSGYENECRD